MLELGYIGRMQTRNRMVETAAEALGLKTWYEALARGCVGLIIVGQCCVDEALAHRFQRYSHDVIMISITTGGRSSRVVILAITLLTKEHIGGIGKVSPMSYTI